MKLAKNNKAKLIFILFFIFIVVVVFIFVFANPKHKNLNGDSTQNTTPSISTNIDNKNIDSIDIDNPDSQFIVVNKNRPILISYEPGDLVLPKVTLNNQKSNSENSIRSIINPSLESLFADAKNNNLNLMLASGYRSAELQRVYYNNLVQSLGQAEADKVSAKPGTSEHQTGLAVDLAPANRQCYLETCFSQLPEGVWLKDNAYKYGFILRYPQGKAEITGYQFEPWHFRYVGKELAQKIYSQNTTLEEYFNL